MLLLLTSIHAADNFADIQILISVLKLLSHKMIAYAQEDLLHAQ